MSRTVCISEATDRVYIQAGVLCIKNAHKTIKLPTHQIDEVIFSHSNAICTKTLHQLKRNGVAIQLLSEGQYQSSQVVTLSYGRNIMRRMKQYHICSEPLRAITLARVIIERKLKSQLKTLRYLKVTDDRAYQHINEGIAQISLCEDISSLLGIEGYAAKCYFSSLATVVSDKWRFNGRNRQPPKDPINALLSYIYSLAHGDAVVISQLKSLDPMLGVLHQPCYSRESLACDWVELVRADIDKWVITAINDGVFNKDDFERKGSACLITKDAKHKVFEHYFARRKAYRRYFSQYCDAFFPATGI